MEADKSAAVVKVRDLFQASRRSLSTSVYSRYRSLHLENEEMFIKNLSYCENYCVNYSASFRLS